MTNRPNETSTSPLESQSSLPKDSKFELQLEALLTENERLYKENAKLRDEITQLRLYNDLKIIAGDPIQYGAQGVSVEAKRFYDVLPDAFAQNDFFNMANDLGFSPEASQRMIGMFLRCQWLVPDPKQGFEKATPNQYELPL